MKTYPIFSSFLKQSWQHTVVVSIAGRDYYVINYFTLFNCNQKKEIFIQFIGIDYHTVMTPFIGCQFTKSVGTRMTGREPVAMLLII